jgi:hypothetical protein
MNIFVVLVLIIVAIAILATFKVKAKKTPCDSEYSFEIRSPLFTPAENSFFGVLEQALGNRYRVLGKVRLGDIIKPAKALSNSKRTNALNKLNQKHVDFVICSVVDLSVFGVIELDDQSDAPEDQTGRDQFVDQALSSAMVPCIHFSAKQDYAIPEVRAKLVEAFNLTIQSSAPTTAKETPASLESFTPPTLAQILAQTEETAPVCPKCAAIMVKRQVKTGPYTGRFFWACSTYPTCRQLIAIEQS